MTKSKDKQAQHIVDMIMQEQMEEFYKVVNDSMFWGIGFMVFEQGSFRRVDPLEAHKLAEELAETAVEIITRHE